MALGTGAPPPRGAISFASGASLAFDFVNGKYRVGVGGYYRTAFTTAQFAGLTISRASPATTYAETVAGVLTPFAANVARITDKGLLVEESRANLCIRSQELNTWTATNATVTADAALAPDGTTTVDLITSTGGSNASVAKTITIGSGATVTISVTAKQSGSRKWFRLLGFQDDFGGTASAYFDLTLGALGTVGGSGPKISAVSATIAPQANGSFRCTLTFTTASMTSLPVFLYASASADAGAPGTGDAVLLWGVQVEAGAFATSYIPTTTAAVTRSADSITLTGLSGLSAGSLIAQYLKMVDLPSSTFAKVFDLGNGGANERMAYMLSNASGNDFLEAISGGVTQASISLGAETLTATGVGIRWATNDFQAARNGVAGTADTSGSVPTIDRIGIGRDQQTSSRELNGYLKSLYVYPFAMTDAQLVAATV